MVIEGKYSTPDLAEATVICLEGYRPKIVVQEGFVCVFEFDLSKKDDGAIEDFEIMLEEYADGEHQVEPKRFTQMLASLRRSMYDASAKAKADHRRIA